MTPVNEKNNITETFNYEIKKMVEENPPILTEEEKNIVNSIMEAIEEARKSIDESNALMRAIKLEKERRQELKKREEIRIAQTEKPKEIPKPIEIPKTKTQPQPLRNERPVEPPKPTYAPPPPPKLSKLEKKKRHEIKMGWKAKLGLGALFAGGGALALTSIFSNGKTKNEKEQDGELKPREISVDTTAQRNQQPIATLPDSLRYNADSIKNKEPKVEPIDLDPDKKFFIQEVYNSLPEQGKEVYKFMVEFDPTPGYGYQILDKDSAKIFVFDKNNYLKGVVIAGFGRTLGDMPNTSEAKDKGDMSTPSGVYFISTASTPVDDAEYGELQYSLAGKTILGDYVYLGEHSTYEENGEYERRTRLLQTTDPSDNNFSNGCINIDKVDFRKYVKPYFHGNSREFFYVLQDKTGKKTGTKFDFKKILKELMPIMLSAAEGKNIEIDPRTGKGKKRTTLEEMYFENKELVNSLSTEIETMTKAQGTLVDIWKKDRKNKLKEKNIADINIAIKAKKQELFKARKFMNFGEKGLKDLENLEKKTNDILAMN